MPRFALQATVNWMRALTILANYEGIDWPSMETFYDHVQTVNLAEPAVNTVFEQLLISLHHLAALSAMDRAGSNQDQPGSRLSLGIMASIAPRAP